MTLQPYTECLVCGRGQHYTIATREQLKMEREYLDQFFRAEFRPDSEDYMFKDHIYFTHTYDAELVVCNGCGTICRDPRLTPEAAYLAYASDEYHPKWLEMSFPEYVAMFHADMPRLVSEVGNNCRVLEVGSQVGGFLYAANQYSWDAQGIDIGNRMVEFSQSKGLKVQQATLLETSFPSNYFDAVFVWSCFEMLPYPQKELQEMFRIIKPNGWLYITVPNGDFIKITQFLTQLKVLNFARKPIWNLLAYSILLGFSFQLGYSPNAIQRILDKTGFRNIAIHNLEYIPVSSTMQLSEGGLRKKKTYLKLCHLLSQVVYWGSLRKLTKGPWMEAKCQK